MDKIWIDGYNIENDGLYAPSGEKIAAIARTIDDGFDVMASSPELKDQGFAGSIGPNTHKSVESACQELVMAHAEEMRVVRFSEIREGVVKIAGSLIQVQGSNNQIQVTPDEIESTLNSESPSKILTLFKDLPQAILQGTVGALIKSIIG